MIEVFSYLRESNCLANVPIEVLKDLFSLDKQISDNYIIRFESKGSILLYNSLTNKTTLLKCVKDYYKINENGCKEIREKLNLSSLGVCKDCHKTCIKLNEDNLINKL